MRQALYQRSIEYVDNRISHLSAQYGKCAITKKNFEHTSDIHCHHKLPKSKGGKDNYNNLVLVLEPVHKLIHATNKELICQYIEILQLNKSQLEKINNYRQMANLDIIQT